MAGPPDILWHEKCVCVWDSRCVCGGCSDDRPADVSLFREHKGTLLSAPEV